MVLGGLDNVLGVMSRCSVLFFLSNIADRSQSLASQRPSLNPSASTQPGGSDPASIFKKIKKTRFLNFGTMERSFKVSPTEPSSHHFFFCHLAFTLPAFRSALTSLLSDSFTGAVSAAMRTPTTADGCSAFDSLAVNVQHKRPSERFPSREGVCGQVVDLATDQVGKAPFLFPPDSPRSPHCFATQPHCV